MINAQIRNYPFYLLEDKNEYGQPTVSTEPQGNIKMCINIASQSVQDNILYSNAQYVGLTRSQITDKYIIQYGDDKLKVLYINPIGRMTQVFLSKV